MNSIHDCNAYLEHLQAQHRRLNGALIKIRHQLVELQRNSQVELQHNSQARKGAVECLESLHSELRAHFSEEEAGGCLEEAAARCLSLGPKVKALMNEHSALIKSLEALIVAIKDQSVGGTEWQQQFETFARNLKLHESAENRLVQFAFGGDIADYDTEGNE